MILIDPASNSEVAADRRSVLYSLGRGENHGEDDVTQGHKDW